MSTNGELGFERGKRPRRHIADRARTRVRVDLASVAGTARGCSHTLRPASRVPCAACLIDAGYTQVKRIPSPDGAAVERTNQYRAQLAVTTTALRGMPRPAIDPTDETAPPARVRGDGRGKTPETVLAAFLAAVDAGVRAEPTPSDVRALEYAAAYRAPVRAAVALVPQVEPEDEDA